MNASMILEYCFIFPVVLIYSRDNDVFIISLFVVILVVTMFKVEALDHTRLKIKKINFEEKRNVNIVDTKIKTNG